MRKNYPKYSLVFILLLTCLFSSNMYGQSFDQSSLDFNGQGNVSNGVTSLMYGPDGRLYVAEYPGLIKILTIARNSSTDYEVTNMEVLNGIQTMEDHNDDGTLFSSVPRETTGLTVGGTSSNPVFYVASSDFRIGAGPGGGNGDVGLDTNSGVITRFSWNGSSWDVVDIVRGLPRSEENHATNGLEIATINGTDYLIVASGGHTNAGGPSTNFVFTCEYALSGAILSINLDMLESMPILNDNGRSYIYDIPTLDDPTRANANGITDPNAPGYNGIDINDPWGGNDGLNQAIVDPSGPVQIYSPGYRNAYDLVLTESGAVYVTDNGANGGWGGFPVNEGGGSATNAYDPLEPGSQSPSGSEQIDNVDHLQLVTTDIQTYVPGSLYGGHPNPTRANPSGAGLYTDNGTTAVFRTLIYDPDGSTPGSTTDPNIGLPANWPPVQTANAVEGDWRGPTVANPDGPDDNPIATWGTNTNGIDEYTASNFGGAMQGDLLAGHSGGLVRRVQLQANGSLQSLTQTFFSGIGGNALGITCNGDGDVFPGTVWTGTLEGGIVVFEPQDFLNCLEPGDAGYDPTADGDLDGYLNQDEVDNGTQVCNGGSQPDDFDKSAGGSPLISDLNDTDDDADGISDATDPFQLGDPTTGGSDAFTLPIFNDLFNTQQGLGGIFGLGMTGLMNNGDTGSNWLDWLDVKDAGPNPNDVLGGAPGIMTSHMTDGTALGNSNNQDKGYQYGVQVDNTTGNFTVVGGMNGFTGPLRLYENTDGVTGGELGFFIGDGTQSNYIKFVVTTDGFTALQEINDVPGTPVQTTISIPNRPSDGIRFYFVVNPSTGSVDLEYQIDNNARTTLGTITALGNVLQAIQSSSTDLAVGFIGSSNTAGKELEGSWDFLNVLGENPILVQQIPDLDRIIDTADEDINLDSYFDDDEGLGNLTYTVQNNTNPAIGTNITGNTLTLSYPSTVESSTITIRATDSDGLFVEDVFTVDVTDGYTILYRVNSGGPQISAIDGDIDWEEDSVANTSQYLSVAGTNTIFLGTVSSTDSSVDTATTPSSIFNSERYDSTPGPPNFQYSFPVAQPGNYEVRLYMGNGFIGTSDPGERIFDVNIEGVNLPLLDNIDLSGTYGHNVGTMISHIITVNDGFLDVEFIHGIIENPLINGIEILDAPDSETPIYVHPIADQRSDAGEQLNGSLGVQAIGGDGNLQYAATGLPTGLFIEPTNGQIGGTVDENAFSGSPFNVTVTVDDSDGLTSDQVNINFSWVIVEPFVNRINAAGSEVSSTDIGSVWEDNSNVGAQSGNAYSVNTGLITNTLGSIEYANRDSSIPAYVNNSVFDALFAQERYDESTNPVMEYDIAVSNGDYVVHMFMGNSFTGTQNVGDRVFDILMEGVVVGDNIDLITEFGHQVAGMMAYPVTVSDGELNISFGHVVENPLINAIEVYAVDNGNPTYTLSNISNQSNGILEDIDFTVSASGGAPGEIANFYIAGQPEGISINPDTGQITGTLSVNASSGGPNGDGIHNVIVTAIKPRSAPSSQNFTWSVSAEFLWTQKNENKSYTARHENAFVQAGDKFYLMGGREAARTIDVYDYSSNTWNSLVDSAPFEFNHFQATEYQGLIWVIGAFQDNAFPNEQPAEHVWAFDPANEEWIQGPQIPANRRRGSAGLVVYNDKFYVVCGNNDGHDGGYVAQFDEYDPTTGTWTPLADAPRARDHFFAAVIGDQLYVAGGRFTGGAGGFFGPTIAEVDVFNFTSGTWSTLPSAQNIPTPRGAPALVNFNDKLVVMGGEVQNELVYGINVNGALNITEQYDPATQSWERLADMNFNRHGTQAIVSGTGIQILGGSPNLGGGNQKTMEYLGDDNPTGTPSNASQLSAPNTLVVNDGETVNLDLDIIDGNVGIFIRSMEISGPNAADFTIDSGDLTNALLNAGGSHSVGITLAGTGTDRSAVLTINYGAASTMNIALTNNPNAEFEVTNPGDQYNYEGDAVSLQIQTTSTSSTTFSATGLPPNLAINTNTGLITGTLADGSGGSGGAFNEQGGLVIVEAETDFSDSAANSGWDIIVDGGTTFMEAHANHFSVAGVGEVVDYDVQINTPGVYRFHMKSAFSGSEPTEENDTWFKIDNTSNIHFFCVSADLTNTAEFETFLGGGSIGKSVYYPAGNAEGRPNFGSSNPGSNGYFKIFRNGDAVGGGNKWSAETIDFNSFAVYVYVPSPTTFTVSMSERSAGHRVDRFALTQIDLQGPGEPITTLDGPESSQGSGGIGAADNSPYNVSVTVTESGTPPTNETVDFVWYVGEPGDLIAVPEADVTSGPAPLTVNFTGSNSLDDLGVTSYLWDFKDGNTSTDADPTHVFTDIGSYDVDLTVGDASGNSDTKSITITVEGAGIAPTAVASATPLTGDAPLEVNFDASGSTDDLQIDSYEWDFIDGGTSSEMNPTYTFVTPGTYDVLLTVTDNEGLTDTDIVSITVEVPNMAPTAVIEATPTTGDFALEVTFTGSNSTDDEGVVGYSWDFIDGGTSTEADPTYTFNAAGTYEVELTVTDAEGLTDTATITITVTDPDNEAPIAVATANPTIGNAPLPVIFNASGSSDDTGIVSYFWDFKDGTTSDEMNPVTTFNTPDTYEVELTVTDGEGLTDTTTISIIVTDPNGNQPPVAIASATPENGDAPLEVSFIGSSSTDDEAVVGYSWDFKDGGTSTDADPTYIFASSGTYEVELTVTDGEGLTNMTTVTIVVSDSGNQAPVAVASATPLTGNAPLEVSFTGSNSTDDNAIVSYTWDFGDGSSSSEENPVYTYQFAGTFDVVLTVEDAEGLVNTATLTIEVEDNDPSGITDFEARIAPNPANATANLRIFNMPQGTVTTMIYLYDSIGRLMGAFQPQDVFTDNQYQIPVHTLRDELYYVKVELSNGDPILIPLLVQNR
ncbi:PKD domain-containing protein [Muricauda sp. 2012CJ35-5]|uniref:PKD domain-containing protein n=1 Tax=Flagellimonas spongiicola TaxID=2942208 RepID=A0ABT0PW08_9FLAO|nr:PKD domain-containing protein [Allomuricauda spongiicola]MCL6275559.1 PKD domain-containing protein [Allomuricauda spongiicola]